MTDLAPAPPLEILQAAGLALLVLCSALALAWLFGKWGGRGS